MTEAVTTRRWWAIGAAGLCVLLGALDTYVVVSLLADIVRDLAIPVNKLEQATPIVTSYLLGYVAAMPLLGQASDRFGRRPVLQVCLVVFLIGSVLTATAGGVVALTIGRAVQGLAGGALLPVTMALVADLWHERERSTALGIIGATQELGSVFGPPYGLAIAGIGLWGGVFDIAGWRGVFWLNVPLTIGAILAVQLGLPRDAERQATKVDVVGGALLAVVLGLLVIGLQNPDPEASYLASWGPASLGGAVVAVIALVLWEIKARTKLMDSAGLRAGPFLATLATSFTTGVALMVTLVDIELLAQTVLGLDNAASLRVLLHFLIALPVGAIVGGFLARRWGDRITAVLGMTVSAGAYWLIANWSTDIAAARYVLGPISLPRMDIDLIAAGIGLGLVIAPLSAAALEVGGTNKHGIAASAVVVARMTGMLIGIAALSAFGLHRFHELTSHLDTPLPMAFDTDNEFQAALTTYTTALRQALTTEYREVFGITAVVCLVGAIIALGITGRDRRSATR